MYKRQLLPLTHHHFYTPPLNWRPARDLSEEMVVKGFINVKVQGFIGEMDGEHDFPALDKLTVFAEVNTRKGRSHARAASLMVVYKNGDELKVKEFNQETAKEFTEAYKGVYTINESDLIKLPYIMNRVREVANCHERFLSLKAISYSSQQVRRPSLPSSPSFLPPPPPPSLEDYGQKQEQEQSTQQLAPK